MTSQPQRVLGTSTEGFWAATWPYLFGAVLRANTGMDALLTVLGHDHFSVNDKEEHRLWVKTTEEHKLPACRETTTATKKILLAFLVDVKQKIQLSDGKQGLPEILAAYVSDPSEFLETPEDLARFDAEARRLDELSSLGPNQFSLGPRVFPSPGNLALLNREASVAVRSSADALRLFVHRALDTFQAHPQAQAEIHIRYDVVHNAFTAWHNGRGVPFSEMESEFGDLAVTTAAEQRRGRFRRSIKDLRALGIVHFSSNYCPHFPDLAQAKHSTLTLYHPNALTQTKTWDLNPLRHAFGQGSTGLSGVKVSMINIRPFAFVSAEALQRLPEHFTLRGGALTRTLRRFTLEVVGQEGKSAVQTIDLLAIARGLEEQEHQDKLLDRVELKTVSFGPCGLELYRLLPGPRSHEDEEAYRRHGILIRSPGVLGGHELTQLHPNLESHPCSRCVRAVLTCPFIDTQIKAFQEGRAKQPILSEQGVLNRSHPASREVWKVLYHWYLLALETVLESAIIPVNPSLQPQDLTAVLLSHSTLGPELKVAAQKQRVQRGAAVVWSVLSESSTTWTETHQGLQVPMALTQPHPLSRILVQETKLTPGSLNDDRLGTWQLEDGYLLLHVAPGDPTDQLIQVIGLLINFIQMGELHDHLKDISGAKALRALRDTRHAFWVPLFRALGPVLRAVD